MRIAERLRAERQQGKNLSSKTFIFLLFLSAVLVAVFLFMNSPYFVVGTVIVEGNKYVSSEEVHRIADIPEQINIFRLNSDTIQRRLASDLRLTDVEVSRKLPASIVIRLKERQPLAYIAYSYGFVQLDRQAVVLAAFKNLKQANVPIITGVRLGNVYIGDRVETEQVKSILQYLDAMDEQTLNKLSEVNTQPPQQLTAYTVDSIVLRIGSTQRLADKARLTQEILQDIHTKKLQVEYVDMNYAKPYIKVKN